MTSVVMVMLSAKSSGAMPAGYCGIGFGCTVIVEISPAPSVAVSGEIVYGLFVPAPSFAFHVIGELPLFVIVNVFGSAIPPHAAWNESDVADIEIPPLAP